MTRLQAPLSFAVQGTVLWYKLPTHGRLSNSKSMRTELSVPPSPPFYSYLLRLTLPFFYSIGAGDTQGFVAVDHTNQLIVIAFRGSVSIPNWIADLTFVMAPWSICTGCQAHAGFLASWESVKSQIQEAVKSATARYPSYIIIATGHSLGGALATLAAADLRHSGYAITLVSIAPSHCSTWSK